MMLNIFYGRSDLDRARFMYENIAQAKADCGKSALVIVPDQYTLEAEKSAFRVLNVKGITDIEVMSFTRLAQKLLGKPDGKVFIDDLGRSMLLRKIISGNYEKLRAFGGAAGKGEFVKMMGSMIQEFKQYKTTPEKVISIAEQNYEKYSDIMLMKKLKDAGVIFGAYEEALKEGYYDTEDYLMLLSEAINRSEELKEKNIWIMGFDMFSKRLFSVMEELLKQAEELNIIMLYDEPGSRDYNLFASMESVFAGFKEISKRCGSGFSMKNIPLKYRKKQAEEIQFLEKNLYAFPFGKYELPEETGNCNDRSRSIELWHCDDRETETRKIACEIQKMIRKRGLRFKDIIVAVNDLPSRRNLIRRIFPEYGIEFFDGSKYAGIYNKFMQFILAFCRKDEIYYSRDSILRVLESGVLDISHDETELLENYLIKYAAEGYLWKSGFYKIDYRGKSEEEAARELSAVNDVREKFVSIAEDLYFRLESCRTGREYSKSFFEFLKETVHMDVLIQEDGDRLKDCEYSEYAGITVQLWNGMTSVLEQLGEILGDYECTPAEFFDVLRSGIESMELSIVPTTADQVLIGDVSSVKMNRAKVLIAAGFNDGVIPASDTSSGIFSDSEKLKLNEIAGEVCIGGKNKLVQEKLNIYQTLSIPEEKLILSYYDSSSGEDSAQKSPLLDRIEKIFSDSSAEENVHFLSEEKEIKSAKDEPGISEDSFLKLYGENPHLSPTSMEAYMRCPFSFFMRYGIKAEERTVFEISPSEMGTVFHEILMRFSEEISERGMWSVMNREKCAEYMNELSEKIASEYKKGFMFEGEMGKYRIERVKSVCEKTAFMISKHINRGSFDKFYFEIPFGPNRMLPPIEIEAENGRKLYIEGRIDRIDIASLNGSTLIKVIDYKSGNEKAVKEEILSGYKLQLMLYMNAAMNGLKEQYGSMKPAGVFYFRIQEPMADAEKSKSPEPEEVEAFAEKEFRKAYKMEGIVVNEPDTVDALDSDFSGFSEIIKVRKLKSGETRGSGSFTALTLKEFDDTMKNTLNLTEEACRDFVNGAADIRPMKISDDTKACTWCRYKSICCFDERIPGFSYR